MGERGVALIFDIDDTLVDRELASRLGGIGLRVLSLGREHQIDPSYAPVVDRYISPEPVRGLYDTTSYLFHERRRVKRDVRGALQLFNDMGFDQYTSSGREYVVDWVNMTEETFKRAGIDMSARFKGSFYTPKGVPGRVSKLASVVELKNAGYDRVFFFDDHIPTAKVLARSDFVDGVFLLENITNVTLFKAREQLRYPKMHRIRLLSDALAHIPAQ